MGLPTLPAAAPRDRQRGPSGGKWTLRERHDQRRTLQPMPGLLTDAEIVRALRRFRYDPDFRGPKRVPIRVLAGLAGLSHMTLYEAMRPDLPMRPRRISGLTRIKLSGSLREILAGRLRFRRRRQVWEIEGGPIWTFEPRRRR
jgi:hypothetical protein